MNCLMLTAVEQKLRGGFKGIIKIDEPLSAHTSIKIGGPAKFFFIPADGGELRFLLRFLKDESIPACILGNGSNLLVTDERLSVAVIQLNSEYFKNIEYDDALVFAGSGVLLANFVSFAAANGLSGCEFLAGIPGTIGGALVTNAGARDINQQGDDMYRNIGDVVKKVRIMDNEANISCLKREDLEFGYRSSSLKNAIILGAWFDLIPAKKDDIRKSIDNFLSKKRSTQELLMPNAGCVFKNPAGSLLSAGALIERCALKGHIVGDAQVSPRHANFIVNRGNARFEHVKTLMNFIQKKVENDFSVRLEPEVEIWEKNE
ncbi:MAG: UDP-N-acetylmuramate dehydrogenase [Candidatus Omnitrophica bacterium]|nr:UDP-N-acetylmuramate dehydrogenase [Candidatus Omnitrophota bacterium]MBU4477999.1 UDP-N-acetylmuramate dehydrogenase [Candidatus Omnitrophota bacterium]MCG2703932.1 UDP-N-acetylmuramate dehydrogenase [Candidatus Omnitrophota bacterium]